MPSNTTGLNVLRHWQSQRHVLEAAAAGRHLPDDRQVETILHHCGLLIPATPRAPPPEEGWVYDLDADPANQPISSEQSGELAYFLGRA